jgi:hypothetical protein
MWLIGGWNPGDKLRFPRICTNDLWSSPDGSTWTLEKPNTYGTAAFDPDTDWEGRHTAGYAVFNDRMWLIGGDALQGHYQDDVWSSADGIHWRRLTQRAPWSPRVLHHTLVHAGRIWVVGGQTLPQFAPAAEHFHDDLWATYDGKHWERVERQEPGWSPRGMIGGSAVFRGRMWLLGGGTYDTPSTPQRRFYNDVWSSADGVHWHCHLGAAPWRPRQYHEVAVFDDRLWVLEGYDGRNRNDVWFSADGQTWNELGGTPWKPRHAASVFVFRDALWVVAGNNMESDVWKLERREARREARRAG